MTVQVVGFLIIQVWDKNFFFFQRIIIYELLALIYDTIWINSFFSVVHINKDGVKLISVDDSNDIHWKLVEEGQGVNQETLSL